MWHLSLLQKSLAHRTLQKSPTPYNILCVRKKAISLVFPCILIYNIHTKEELTRFLILGNLISKVYYGIYQDFLVQIFFRSTVARKEKYMAGKNNKNTCGSSYNNLPKIICWFLGYSFNTSQADAKIFCILSMFKIA